MMLLTLLIPVVLRMHIIHELFMWPTILDKTVEKIAYLGGIFSKLCSRPILPSPLPLEAVLLGLQKKAGSLSIYFVGRNSELGEGVFFTQSR